MEFTFEKTELTVNFVEKMIFNFRKINNGNFPSRILISLKSAKILLDENRYVSSAISPQPPYKIFGLKVIRTIDLDDNTIELF